jgi:hypothetical protein
VSGAGATGVGATISAASVSGAVSGCATIGVVSGAGATGVGATIGTASVSGAVSGCATIGVVSGAGATGVGATISAASVSGAVSGCATIGVVSGAGAAATIGATSVSSAGPGGATVRVVSGVSAAGAAALVCSPSSRGVVAGAGIGPVVVNSGACSGGSALDIIKVREAPSEGSEKGWRTEVAMTASFSPAGCRSSKPPAVAATPIIASCAMGDRNAANRRTELGCENCAWPFGPRGSDSSARLGVLSKLPRGVSERTAKSESEEVNSDELFASSGRAARCGNSLFGEISNSDFDALFSVYVCIVSVISDTDRPA